MRLSSLALTVSLAGLVSMGCAKATVIGTACKTDKDCNVKDQVCVAGYNGGPSICTHACTGNTGANGCPVGYDCFPVDAAKGSTCTRTLYEVDATGKPLLFGVDCSGGNDICAATGTTNQFPECRRVSDGSKDPMPVDFDPNAYCTGICTTDNDCPLDFYCGKDYDEATKCLHRRLCAPCTIDANCGGEWPICVPTKDGSARYCSKTCNTSGDCGGTANTAFTCSDTTNGAGTAIKACTHRYGACVGEGKICDPCLSDDDCKVAKSVCIVNIGTSEGFCTIGCMSDTQCTSQAGTVMTSCDNQHVGSAADPYGMSFGFCNGDYDHSYVAPGYPGPEGGLYSCWLPE